MLLAHGLEGFEGGNALSTLECFQTLPQTFDRRGALDSLHQSLVGLGRLHDEARPAVDREEDGPAGATKAAHEGRRIALEVGEGMLLRLPCSLAGSLLRHRARE